MAVASKHLVVKLSTGIAPMVRGGIVPVAPAASEDLGRQRSHCHQTVQCIIHSNQLGGVRLAGTSSPRVHAAVYIRAAMNQAHTQAEEGRQGSKSSRLASSMPPQRRAWSSIGHWRITWRMAPCSPTCPKPFPSSIRYYPEAHRKYHLHQL